MGEALASLRRRHPEHAARIPDLQGIVGFRNVLIHGYASVNDALVWNAIGKDLPALMLLLTELLEAFD